MRRGYSSFDPAVYQRLVERNDRKWVEDRLDLLPKHWRCQAEDEFDARRKHHAAGANIWLRELTEPLKALNMSLAFTEGDIRDKARELALSLMDVAGRRSSLEEARVALASRLSAWGIEPPGEIIRDRPAVARMTDEYWLRRRLRKTLNRTIEQATISAGLVHRRAGIYISEDGYTRRQEQRRRNAAVIEEIEIVNEEGEAIDLAEVVAHSLANPRIRRGEVMTRVRGFEEVAKTLGHAAVFITLTCPSRFHARHYESGEQNFRHDGSTPREAQAYLRDIWARIRSKLKRDEVTIYGLRVAEPHHDGTPHWHLLVFLSEDQLGAMERVVRHHALAESPDELGAQERRVGWELIDSAKGSATGYVAKYISKNLDAHQVEVDFEGCDGKTGAMRAEAWASTWGIRQFQQIGGPPVSVWRELRKLPREGVMCPITEPIRQAADNGDWGRYVQAMGGPGASRKGHPLGIHYRNRANPDQTTTEFAGNGAVTVTVPVTVTGVLLNSYGEPAATRIAGLRVRDTGEVIETRLHEWRFQRKTPQASTPRTRVNKCTDAATQMSDGNRVTNHHNGVITTLLPHSAPEITLFQPEQTATDLCTHWPPPS